jgi:hypothetical protein
MPQVRRPLDCFDTPRIADFDNKHTILKRGLWLSEDPFTGCPEDGIYPSTVPHFSCADISSGA